MTRTHLIRWALPAALVLLALPSRSTGAQQTACYPLRADSVHQKYLDDVRTFTGPPDSAWAAAAQAGSYPTVPSSEVVLVRTKAVCNAAAQAYARELNGAGYGLSGKVYVIQARTVYLVVDPDYHYAPGSGGVTTRMLFDLNWRLLHKGQ
jgi:hypothetical protein